MQLRPHGSFEAYANGWFGAHQSAARRTRRVQHALDRSVTKVRSTRTKRKRPRVARAISDAAVLRTILADVRRLERHREREMQQRVRDVDKLSNARKAAPARQLAETRQRLHDAQLASSDVVRLRHDIESILATTSAKLAAVEVELTANVNAAITRYVVAMAARGATATLQMAPAPRRRDFATELAKAKQATAIAIADRNKMRHELALLTADPQRGTEAKEWRRELTVQEATVEHLKEGLRLLHQRAG